MIKHIVDKTIICIALNHEIEKLNTNNIFLQKGQL